MSTWLFRTPNYYLKSYLHIKMYIKQDTYVFSNPCETQNNNNGTKAWDLWKWCFGTKQQTNLSFSHLFIPLFYVPQTTSDPSRLFFIIHFTIDHSCTSCFNYLYVHIHHHPYFTTYFHASTLVRSSTYMVHHPPHIHGSKDFWLTITPKHVDWL